MSDEEETALAIPATNKISTRKVEEIDGEPDIGKFDGNNPFLSQSLPKWPQMIVVGHPVTVDQAEEIIRRTDMFFRGYGGNDHDFDARLRQLCRMSPERSYDGNDANFQRHPWPVNYEYDQRWRGAWGFLDTAYVHTDWISSCYIGGPHGWVHPNGGIGANTNVGKWPSCEEIFHDWMLISAAWPFLDLGVVLMNDENVNADTSTPILGFRIKDGQIEIVDPKTRDLTAELPYAETKSFEEHLAERGFRDQEHEHGAPEEWFSRWEALATQLFDEEYRNL